MDFKKTVKKGYNTIADRYLAERRRDSEHVRLLEPPAIRPKQLRMGDANFRGYELEDIADGCSCYLPGFAAATLSQRTSDVAFSNPL